MLVNKLKGLHKWRRLATLAKGFHIHKERFEFEFACKVDGVRECKVWVYESVKSKGIKVRYSYSHSAAFGQIEKIKISEGLTFATFNFQSKVLVSE